MRPGLVVGRVGFWCAACSGTPFGEQLAERLSEPDDPAEETAVPEATVPNGAATNVPSGEQLPEEPGDPMEEETPPATLTANPATVADSPNRDPSPRPPAATPPQETSPAGFTMAPSPLPPLNPTPYRLLLRLPEADPEAPAEAVTQALRAAGILFEVETIERLPDQPAPSTPPDPSP
ncbi:MAG TPA: hypothetical protein DD643_07135 [Synechococcus sp. UBA8638]|nr:hypothetical protein [Synechococcus sp. UBA8638]